MRDILQQIVTALADGQLTRGELTDEIANRLLIEIEEWRQKDEGEVLIEVDPVAAMLLPLVLVFANQDATREERAAAFAQLMMIAFMRWM